MFQVLKTYTFACLLIGSLVLLLGACSSSEQTTETPKAPAETKTSKKIVAYVFGAEDNWGPNLEKAKQITHINFAFANLQNGRVREGRESDVLAFRKLNGLKKVNPDLKILISIGGWTWSGGFSDVALSESGRKLFAQSAVALMERNDLDGIDIDWEYPGLPGAGNVHRREDKENFTALLKAVREELNLLTASTNKQYLLTIASAASQAYLDNTDLGFAHQYLDFINIMTYDYYGGWDPKTGHHSNLYASPYDTAQVQISSALAVQQHITEGIPVEKLVMGVPFYGRYWTGVAAQNNGLYQVSTGPSGGYDYKTIADSLLKRADFKLRWDTAAKAPYLWRASDQQLVTYENPRSLKEKMAFVQEQGMGGVMFWQFNDDNGDLLETLQALREE